MTAFAVALATAILGIVDGIVEVTVPRPGEGVYAGVLTDPGAQELDVLRRDDGGCPANDGKSVVFGTLPKGATASTCDHYWVEDGYDRPASTDLKLDKAHHSWTTRPGARSCRNRYDLESTVIHERGHAFGLGHVSEATSGGLTMSPNSNVPCQISERTLGRGAVLGLDNEYR